MQLKHGVKMWKTESDTQVESWHNWGIKHELQSDKPQITGEV